MYKLENSTYHSALSSCLKPDFYHYLKMLAPLGSCACDPVGGGSFAKAGAVWGRFHITLLSACSHSALVVLRKAYIESSVPALQLWCCLTLQRVRVSSVEVMLRGHSLPSKPGRLSTAAGQARLSLLY